MLNTKVREESSLLDCLTKFSDRKRAVKVIALLKQIKGIKDKVSGATSIEERQEAELFIIKLVQREAFSSEIRGIKQGKEVELQDKVNNVPLP